MCVRYAQPAHAQHPFLPHPHLHPHPHPHLLILQAMDSSSLEKSDSTTTMCLSFCKHPNPIQTSQTTKRRTSSNTVSPTEQRNQVLSTACRMPLSKTASSVCWCMLLESPTKSSLSTSATTTKETRAVSLLSSTPCSARSKHVLSSDVLI